jgi:hypothetical protein
MKTQYLKSYTFYILFLSFLLLTGMKCKKDSISFNTKDKLPAITQEGKNTFGFLLNGEVWVPSSPYLQNKLDLSYDPSYMGGTINITAKRYLANGEYESLSIGSYNINTIGTYQISKDKVGINLSGLNECTYLRSDINTSETGFFTITNLNLTTKVISGTFNFKVEKNSCPTINVTQGRFDLKIE